MASRPVIVVGIGRAGCSILSEIASFADTNQTSNQYQLIAIDSNIIDLMEKSPESALRYRLSVDSQEYIKDALSLGYLEKSGPFVPNAGTTRRRPLGRYLVDSKTDAVEFTDFFDQAFTSFISAFGGTGMKPHVWIVNSLGGGTGSGAFLLISIILQRYFEREAIDVECYGIGTLPRVDGFDYGSGALSGEVVHYANAYTALSELQTVMNLDGETEYPLRLEVNSASSDINETAVDIEQSPFDGYWLLAVNEDVDIVMEQFHQTEKTAARLIHFLSEREEQEWYNQSELYSVAERTIATPVEDLRRYIQVDKKLQELDQQKSNIKQKRREVQRLQKQIDNVLEIEAATLLDDEVEDGSQFQIIGEKLLDQCIECVDSLLTSHTDFDKITRHIAVESEALAALPNQNSVESLDTNLLPKYAMVSIALVKIEQSVSTHEIIDKIEYLTANWNIDSDLSGSIEFDTLDNSQPSGPTMEKIEYIVDSLRALKDDFERQSRQSVLPSGLSMAGRNVKRIQEEIEGFEKLTEDYRLYLETRKNLLRQREKLHDTLQAQATELQEQIEQLHKEHKDVRLEWSRYAQERETLKKGLATPEPIEGKTHLRLQVPTEDQLTYSSLSDTSYCNLETLNNNGLIEIDELVETIERELVALNDPVEDMSATSFGRKSAKLGVLSNETDSSILTDIFNNNIDNFSESLHKQLHYKFRHSYGMAKWNLKSELSLLGMYHPIDLNMMSEFSPIHNRFTDNDSTVSEIFHTITDEDINSRFAYPELK